MSLENEPAAPKVFDLLHELLRCTKVSVIQSQTENISDAVNKLVSELERRTGQQLGHDASKWADWFCDADSGYPLGEREAIGVMRRLVDAENKFLPKIQDRGEQNK